MVLANTPQPDLAHPDLWTVVVKRGELPPLTIRRHRFGDVAERDLERLKGENPESYIIPPTLH